MCDRNLRFDCVTTKKGDRALLLFFRFADYEDEGAAIDIW